MCAFTPSIAATSWLIPWSWDRLKSTSQTSGVASSSLFHRCNASKYRLANSTSSTSRNSGSVASVVSEWSTRRVMVR